MAITTLLFDLSEVFIAGMYGLEKTLAPLVKMEERAIIKALSGEGFHQLMCGKVTEEEYITGVMERQGWAMPIDEVKRLIRNNFAAEVPGMRALLQRLDYPGRPYRLVLLSDHGAEWVAHIRSAHAFLAHFDRMFFSFELGQTKAVPETFRQVLDMLGSPAEETLFIDDNADNVRCAESVGIQGIMFQGAEELERELARRGVKVGREKAGSAHD